MAQGSTIQHRHSPEGFHARRTRRLECLCTTAGYNDVSGFAEVYWDAAARILVKATDYNARSISIHSRIVRSCRSAAARYGRSSDRYRSCRVVRLRALSENLTERPPLRNFLHPLNREEPTLVTAIRLAGDTEEGTGLGEMRREQGYD